MRSILTALLVLAIGLGPSTAAEPPESGLPGHYYLSGMTEVGSELLLKESGRFEWALMYGAQDMVARGQWRRQGDAVVLSTAAPAIGEFRLFTEDELNLKKEPKAGNWVAIVGVPRTGPMEGIEVQFVAASGKKASAVSAANGDAIVAMPASERWVRAGLRRAKSNDAWVWFEVPPARASARIAAFAVTNWQALIPAPFASLRLRVEDGKLVVEENAMGLRGAYSKGGG
ncbi:hypothetical protein LQ564_18915 [Massilia sp. G4R7]|uniref:DUF3108 domain-containing protein n=1 Tax=Massilia phyllostachyos TaxID=2898585 RepID=A0ABS8Q9E3_9BURK|nr:hypothetical protein [Massilia phyllostachyos]MCD2518376.1 hypothetical protein [Massilia phyllostachyos]